MNWAFIDRKTAPTSALVLTLCFCLTSGLAGAAEKKTVEEWADIGLKATDREPWDHASVLTASNALHTMSAEALPKVREWIGFERKLHPVVEQLRAKIEPKPTPPTPEELAAIKLDAERTLFVVYSLQTEARPLFVEWSRPQRAGLSPNLLMEVLNADNIPHLVAVTNPEQESDYLWTLLWQFPRWGTNGAAGGPFLRKVLDSAIMRESSSDFPDRAAVALAVTGHDSVRFAKEVAAMGRETHVMAREVLGAIGPAGWEHLLTRLHSKEPIDGVMALKTLLEAKWMWNGYANQQPRFRFGFGFFRPNFIPNTETDWQPQDQTRVFIRRAPEASKLRMLLLAEESHFGPDDSHLLQITEIPRILVFGLLDMLEKDPSPAVAKKVAELRVQFEQRTKARLPR